MKTTVSGCPIEDAMRLLSGRWRTLLVYYLIDGKKRFAQLRRVGRPVRQDEDTRGIVHVTDATPTARSAGLI